MCVALWQTDFAVQAAVVIAAMGGGVLGGLIAELRGSFGLPGPGQYRFMIERAGEGIAILRGGRIAFANPSLGALLRCRRPQLLGRPFECYVTAGQRERVREIHRWLLDGETAFHCYETELLPADGGEISVQVRSHVEYQRGQALHFVFVRDISKQRAVAEQVRALNEYMDSIIDNADIWLNTLDKEGRIVIWNKAAERISGYRRDEVQGCTDIWTWLYPDETYRAGVFSRAMDILERDTVAFDLETTIRTKDSRQIVLSWRSRMLTNTAGETVGSIAVARDVTLERRAQEALQLHASVFETAEPLAIANRQRVFLRVNRAFTRMFGYPAEEIIGRTLLELQPDQTPEGFFARLWEELEATDQWSGELWERRKDGTLIPAHLTMSTVRGVGGAITHYVAHWQDISERKTFEAEIQRQALYDPLTGLPNRRLAASRLEQELGRAQRLTGFGALLFLDLDRFKQVNDAYGHARGDALLASIARRLQNILRIEDMAARLGGDEFIVLLGSEPGTRDEAAARAHRVGEKILAVIGEPTAVDAGELSVSASVGIALYPDANMNAVGLLQMADSAMYHAKEGGRNTIRFFAEASRTEFAHRQSRFCERHPSIDDEQLLLSYQPIADASGRFAGIEALVRWQSSERGLRLPTRFLTVVEETGLAAAVDCWVISAACRRLAAWQSEGVFPNRLRLAVNISPQLLTLHDFPRHLRRILWDSGVQPQALVLEITEAALCNDVQKLASAMRTTRDWGIGFSVDEFGTGHTPLAQLELLPIDIVKIAQTLVAEVPGDDAKARLIKRALRMAGRLGVGAAAEGIDTHEQFDCLRSGGCRLFQGNCISGPLTEEALITLLRTDRIGFIDEMR
ncbi:MAG: EAL domain-containing protein [Nitrococcus mobilis]|nr:EAL domain-containing protein [Nitrococcus mobilis]